MRALAHIPSKTVTSGYRAIKDGSRYNTYFPPPDERDRVIIKDGEVTDTVELMEKVVWKYLDDTKRIAPLLMRPSTLETCQAIWEYIHNFIQYKLDQRGLEQLRRPARSWAERATGVDCDCMSIFTSSILTNLKIPHSFRITKYSQDSWQHVYVIVPIAGANNYCVIDAVVSEFNYEKKYTDKMDYPMNLKGINVAVLSGISGNNHYEAVMATSLSGIGLGATTNQSDLDKLYQNLVATRNAVAQNPSLVSTVDDPQALIKMLDYAIQYWYTDKRNEALDILAKNEAQLNLQNGVNTMNGLNYDPDDLALSGINVKGFFTNVKKTVKTVGQKVGQAAKVAVKAVVKYNPLSIAARGGFLLAMKLNLGKMASKLKWAYGTQQQAAAKNVSASTWQKSKDALVKVEKLFADKLQGSRDALKNAILKGRAGNLSGYVEEQMSGYLGDPASATVIAAAADKQISSATQASLNLKANTTDLALKANIASPTFTGTVSGIDKVMVGLEQVNNTSDAAKPISVDTQTALDLKASTANLDLKAPIASPAFTGNVTGIDKTMVGLELVDNSSDAAKPISYATQAALNLKASTIDLDLKAPIASPAFTGNVTGINKTMVGLEQVNNTSDANKPISDATQAALDLKAPRASPAFTGNVTGIDRTMVGLELVDNTSDADKPISSATLTALNLKANTADLNLVNNTSDLLKPISNDTQTALNLKANIESLVLTGIPLAPTATFGTNTDQIATTAFVMNNLNPTWGIDEGTEVSTTSTTDEVIPNMSFTPGAGTYIVFFNGQYESSSIGTTEQGVEGLTAAYNEISTKTTTINHDLVFVNNEVLIPGVYSVAGAGSIPGNLVLDAGGDPNALFIFKINGALTSGAGANILLTNSAKASNVFWITTPGNAIALGATITMKGTLIANGAAISMGADGVLEGRLLSTLGAVSFGPGTAYLPSGISPINLGGVANFLLFTSAGGVANTGASILTGNIGTNSGAITGFETATVTGFFFKPGINGDALATFSVYQNGAKINNSSRERWSNINTADTALQAIATVADGQAIDIRWNTSVGILKLRNRIVTIMKVK